MLLPSGYSTNDYSVLANRKGWSAGWPACQNPATTITLDRTGQRLQVHPRTSRLWTLLLNRMESGGYLCHRPENWCWGAECRAISGTNTPSNHSFNNAVDLNAPNNPYTSNGTHDIPDWVFAMFRRFGFGLGADYSGKKDWMHVEFMGTPGDADIMTAAAEREYGSGGTGIITPPTEDDSMSAADVAELKKYIDAKFATIPDAVWDNHFEKTTADGGNASMGDIGAATLRELREARALQLGMNDKLDAMPTLVWVKSITDEAANVLLARAAGANPNPPAQTYTVKAGDSFNAIAKSLGVTPDALGAANPSITDRGNLAIGQVLNIPK